MTSLLQRRVAEHDRIYTSNRRTSLGAVKKRDSVSRKERLRVSCDGKSNAGEAKATLRCVSASRRSRRAQWVWRGLLARSVSPEVVSVMI